MLDLLTTNELSGLAPFLSERDKREIDRLLTWQLIARPEQLPPSGDWLIWLIEAGRGWGKTQTGAEWIWEQAKKCPRLAIVAPTFGDARDACIEGETGIKFLHPNLDFNRSIGEMSFPSGCKGRLFSGQEPDRLRGPNNYAAWCDEFSSWQYQQATWDMLMFTLRKGESRTCITTTPRKSDLLRELEKRLTTKLVRRTTYDNIANLSKAYIDNIIKPYEGTRLGQQELNAIVLDDTPGALWTHKELDALRWKGATPPQHLTRIVVGVDPEATSGENSSETGIIVAARGEDGHGYVLDDVTLRATPHVWASAAVTAYHTHRANLIVYETNQGGEMVEHTLKTVDERVPLKGVHASKSKVARAEPIAALYEQGKVHHVGVFAELEDQLCNWLPGDKSPDRLDAMVWALTELMLGDTGTAFSMRF